jgi:hydrogenase/urease accessory protein HupE
MKVRDSIGLSKIIFAVISVAFFLCIGVALGHESQPGAVEIRELGPDRYEVIWRAPLYYNKPHPARLELPEAWEIIGQPVKRARPDAIVFQQRISTGGKSLDGAVIRFPGLESTITDVFIRVIRADGSAMTAVARPTRPWAELRGERPWYQTAREYLLLGLHHILMGIDHLLFVLGLLLIVQQRMALIKTITSFTIAHSITLGVATLGYAHVPLPPLNAAIALSILFLGPEIIRVQKGKTSLTIQYPWLIAFGFGLLHGFGFASGLATAGMPKAELPWALLWFNIGVELGQILFVFLALGLTWSFRILQVHWPRWALKVPGYTVGSLGAYWTIQRTFMMIGGL